MAVQRTGGRPEPSIPKGIHQHITLANLAVEGCLPNIALLVSLPSEMSSSAFSTARVHTGLGMGVVRDLRHTSLFRRLHSPARHG